MAEQIQTYAENNMIESNSYSYSNGNNQSELDRLFSQTYGSSPSQTSFQDSQTEILFSVGQNRAATSYSEEGNEDLTISALLHLSDASTVSTSSTRRCRFKLCYDTATKRSPFCINHIGSRVCDVLDCKKYAQGGTSFCISHGGGHRCTFPGCSKGARGKVFCALHGGGKRCCVTDCKKLAVGGSVMCAAHGGGKKCIADGCTKTAQSPTQFCVRHGGGRKCRIDGCQKVSRGKTGCCASHGNKMKAMAVETKPLTAQESNIFSAFEGFSQRYNACVNNTTEFGQNNSEIYQDYMSNGHANPVFFDDAKDVKDATNCNTPPIMCFSCPPTTIPSPTPGPLVQSDRTFGSQRTMNHEIFVNESDASQSMYRAESNSYSSYYSTVAPVCENDIYDYMNVISPYMNQVYQPFSKPSKEV